jgi:hypothetical protein
MTLTTARFDDLRQRLTDLRARFADVGGRAASTARDMATTVVPSEALLDELTAVSRDFATLRDVLVEQGSTLEPPPDAGSLTTLGSLDEVVVSLERAEAERARRAAWEAARESALGVLDKVMALIHREDKELPALAECQAKARELHGSLSSAPPADLEHETTMLPGRVRAFGELVTLAEGWNRLDDERCAFLQDAITQNFGRALALAALRGKLGHEGEVFTPEPRRGRGDFVAAPPGYAGSQPVGGAETAAGVPTTGYVPAAAAPGAAAPTMPGTPGPVVTAPPGSAAAASGVPGVAAGAPVAGAPAAGPSAGVVVTTPGGTVGSAGAVPAAGGVAMPGAPLVVEIRLSGERVQVETADERRAREDLLERLAADTAQWWLRARAGWESLVERGTPPRDAAREALTRFPYLLSVPLARSDEFENGGLAEGYAILLQRLEKDEPGFVREALTRLNPQFTTRARDEKYPLGQELYLYVVAEGRLYKTYPDFLRDIIVHVLPEPGVWLQGGIAEAEDSTTIATRGDDPGERRQHAQTLTEAAERFTTHTFTVTTGPLTTRFFAVQAAAELADPTDVEIRLKENDAPTDHAWIVVTPMTGKPDAPRRHRVGGTKVEALGKQCRAVWIAAFNSDPNNDRRYELTVALKRKTPPPPKPEAKAAEASKPSPFGRRR